MYAILLRQLRQGQLFADRFKRNSRLETPAEWFFRFFILDRLLSSVRSTLTTGPKSRDHLYALIDGTIVQVHQKATGSKGGLSIRPLGARAVG